MNQLDEMQKLISLMENNMAQPEPVVEDPETDEHDGALQELQDIAEQLHDLSNHAKSIMKQYFPEEYQTADAYGALDFGSSSNQYDTTFMAILDDLLSGAYN